MSCYEDRLDVMDKDKEVIRESCMMRSKQGVQHHSLHDGNRQPTTTADLMRIFGSQQSVLPPRLTTSALSSRPRPLWCKASFFWCSVLFVLEPKSGAMGLKGIGGYVTTAGLWCGAVFL